MLPLVLVLKLAWLIECDRRFIQSLWARVWRDRIHALMFYPLVSAKPQIIFDFFLLASILSLMSWCISLSLSQDLWTVSLSLLPAVSESRSLLGLVSSCVQSVELMSWAPLPVVTSPVIRVIAMIKDNYTASSIAGGMVKAAGGCCPLDIVCGGIFKLPLMNTS